MVRTTKETQRAITQEKRAEKIIESALANPALMDGVREAQEQIARGEKSENWADLKKRLRLV